MSFVLQPWQLIVVIVSAWITKLPTGTDRHVMTENKVLKEKLSGKRILLDKNGGTVTARKSPMRSGIRNVYTTTARAHVGNPHRA